MIVGNLHCHGDRSSPSNPSPFTKLLNPHPVLFCLQQYWSLLIFGIIININNPDLLLPHYVPGSVLSMHFSRLCENCTCELIFSTHSTLESEKLPSHPQAQPVPLTQDTPYLSLIHSGPGATSLHAVRPQALHPTLNQALL